MLFVGLSDIVCDHVLGKSLQQCLGLYFQLKDDVFRGHRPYSSEPLEEFLKREFGETTRMSEIKDVRVIVTGVLADRLPGDLHLFRNYDFTSTTTENSPRTRGPQLQPPPEPNGILSFQLPEP